MIGTQTNLATGSVLIVDNKPGTLRLLAGMLTERGYTVHTVASGSAALKAAATKQPDILLLNSYLPDIDSFEVCRLLKGQHDTADIPIIFLSVQGDVIDKVRAFAAGGADYITRPFQVEEVLMRIQNQMSLRQTQMALREREHIYRAMFENNRAIKLLIEPTTGAIIDANHAASTFYGYPLDVLRMMHITDINTMPLEEAQAVMQRAHREQSNYFLFQHRLASGEIRDVEAYTNAIQIQGRTLIYAIVHDITTRKQAEEALRVSEEHFRELVEGTSDLVTRIDPTGRFLYVNHVAEHIFGLPAESCIGLNSFDFVHPADRTHTEASFTHWLQQRQTSASIETRMVSQSHEVHTMLWTVNLHYDDSGHAAFINSIARDITERKHMEQALQESQSLLQGLVNYLPGAIYVKDVQGRYLLANDFLLTALNLTRDQIIGKTEHEVFPSEIVASWQSSDQQVITTGDPLFYEQTFSDASQENTYITIKFPIFDNQGRVYATGGISTDITARKQAEEALRANEERLRLLFQAMPVMVEAFDENWNIIVWNGECERVTGYTAEEMRHNSHAMELLYPDPLYRAQLMQRISSAEQPFHNDEWDITCKDGSIKTIAWSNISWHVPIPGWARWAIGIDVTERRRVEEQLFRYAEELEQRAEESQQFAYIVSHDLRAPLITLKGFAAELHTTQVAVRSAIEEALPYLPLAQRQSVSAALDVDMSEALKFINAAVERMDRLINALLKLARLGRRELYLEPVNMRLVVQTTLHTLAHQIETRQVHITVGDLPTVIADRTAMEQIMSNILHNAVLYLEPSRPGRIEVSSEQDPEEIRFLIRDNGRGIAPEDMDEVFAPFRRAGTASIPGEGMGLAYVQALVRRHGGTIRCMSEPGVGTTFIVGIPHRGTAQRHTDET